VIKKPSGKSIVSVNRKKSRELKLSKFPKQKLGKSLDQVKERLGSIDLSEKLATRLQCGHEEMILSFTKEFDTKAGINSLTKNKGIPLIMLKKRGCPEEFFVSHYFFATPSKKKNEIDIQGVRPNGTITYSGTLMLGKEDSVCTLKGVKNIYDAAIDVEVVINHEEQYIKANKAISDTSIDRKSNPYRIPKPATG
jgi:hypothetical protein